MGREFKFTHAVPPKFPLRFNEQPQHSSFVCRHSRGGRAVNASLTPFPYLALRLGNRFSGTIFGCLSIPASSVLPGSLLWYLHLTYPFIEYGKYAYMTKYNQLNAPLSRSSRSARITLLLPRDGRNRIISPRMERMASCDPLSG